MLYVCQCSCNADGTVWCLHWLIRCLMFDQVQVEMVIGGNLGRQAG